jgi:Rps23 Pro-64 3,4-dihydroxylase Tpa1-like proline 4-hydroxylase
MTEFALNPTLDPEALSRIYATSGRIQIRNFLSTASAEALMRELETSDGWRLAVNRGDQIIEYGAEAYAALSEEQRAKLTRAVELGGRYNFQFRYDSIRVGNFDDSPSLVASFRRFLSSSELVAFLRQVTGVHDIDFADAHASRYRTGHFLTGHDDHVEAMGRRAAYVMNLTREWLPEWGGLLLFHDDQGNIARGYTPGFNVLNLFSVPQRHSVSWVTPLAGQSRYAVTGWLRNGAPS